MSGGDDSSDRRRAERVPVNSAFADVPSTTYISDLSEGGVFIHTRRRAPLGSIVELNFTVLLDDPLVLTGAGVVVRHSDDPPGMGIRFVDPSPELILRINDVVARQRPIEMGEPRQDPLDDEQTVHRAPIPTAPDELESQKTGLYPSIRIQIHDFDGSEPDEDAKTSISGTTMQLDEADVEEILAGNAVTTSGTTAATVDLEGSQLEFIRRHKGGGGDEGDDSQ
jgi:Tfp pilus assembly protein PilZ